MAIHLHRRQFIKRTTALTAASGLGLGCLEAAAKPASKGQRMQLGLVTYQWGKDMDLPTLLDTCEESEVLGLELRTQHAHRVEPALSKKDRLEVKQRFADSPVTLVGYGSNAQYHENDPVKVKQNIELTKAYIHLMHDCGGSGVKVKPNGFVRGIPREQTIEQIGKALNEVAAYGEKYGQEIRVEVHGGGPSELPVVKAIFDVADHKNVAVCWNSNNEDLSGKGLEHNFNLVKDRFGKTVHIRELNLEDYPYADLMKLFIAMDYEGWILLEARTDPKDKVAALKQQRKIFRQMVGQG